MVISNNLSTFYFEQFNCPKIWAKVTLKLLWESVFLHNNMLWGLTELTLSVTLFLNFEILSFRRRKGAEVKKRASPSLGFPLVLKGLATNSNAL